MSEEAALAEKTWASEIKELGDKIVGLTILQARDLADYLKEEHGLEAAAAPVAVAAVPGGGESADGGEEEKTAFNVVLKDVGGQKIQVIKVVRSLTELGLKEAKALVDAAPKAVKEGVSKEEAEKIKGEMEAVGATVEIE